MSTPRIIKLPSADGRTNNPSHGRLPGFYTDIDGVVWLVTGKVAANESTVLARRVAVDVDMMFCEVVMVAEALN